MKIGLHNFYAPIRLKKGQGIYCKCGNYLYEVSDGLFDKKWICEKCHKIYQLELREISKKKISKEYMDQSIKQLNEQNIFKRRSKK